MNVADIYDAVSNFSIDFDLTTLCGTQVYKLSQ